MGLKIITSWHVLFKYAHSVGQARLAHKDFPTDANRRALDEAIRTHDQYRDMCLEADEMIGLPVESFRR